MWVGLKMVQVFVAQRMMGVDLRNATAVPLTFQRVFTNTDVPQGLGHQWVKCCVLSVADKFSNFAWSHGYDQSLPHSQLKLLAQDEFHGFAVTPQGPGIIKHCAITQAGTVVKNYLRKELYVSVYH